MDRYERKYNLKPCPFCGSAVRIDNIGEDDEKYYVVECTNDECSACASFGYDSESLEMTAEAWNKRVGEEDG